MNTFEYLKGSSMPVSAIGAFNFVLHSHLPYARMAGRWPHGEEWIHEAATETYLPLLQALYDLRLAEQKAGRIIKALPTLRRVRARLERNAAHG